MTTTDLDLPGFELRITRQIAAPPAAVWRVWTERLAAA